MNRTAALLFLFSTCVFSQGNAASPDQPPQGAQPAPAAQAQHPQDAGAPPPSVDDVQVPDFADPVGEPMAESLPAGEDGIEYAVYQTEPNLQVPKLKIQYITEDLSKIQPGYIFFDPMSQPTKFGLGPMMFDTYTAELVWAGKPWNGYLSWSTQNTHVCDFNGTIAKHICYTENYHHRTSQHRVFNQYYESVEPVVGFNGTAPFFAVDPHEFTMNSGGMSYQQIIYHGQKADLTPLGGLVNGSILDPCFQEVDVNTGQAIFSWCAYSHGLKPEESSLTQPSIPNIAKVATGYNMWDFAHANAVDKSPEGDYIFSIRYYNQIWKVAGPNATIVHGIEPGTVMWKFGVNGDFKVEPEGEFFYWQHDCRFISVGPSETIITLFDNHNTRSKEEFKSAGRMYKLNNQTMTATLMQKFETPEVEPSMAQGSMRILSPSGNIFIGWGQRPFFSELDPTGNRLLHVTYRDDHGKTYNYRARKALWQGWPRSSPKIVAYSVDCSSTPVIVWLSWNGATEVRSWRISISVSPMQPWVVIGIFPKTGFETRIELSKFTVNVFAGATPRYVQAEALDEDGNVLGLGDMETFVPRPEIVQPLACDVGGCHGPKHFLYETSQNYIHECKPGRSVSWTTVVSLFLGVEGILYLNNARSRLGIHLGNDVRPP